MLLPASLLTRISQSTHLLVYVRVPIRQIEMKKIQEAHNDMNIDAQDAVYTFVTFVSAQTNEKIEIIARPDRDERNLPAVEELWESATRRYAIEHYQMTNLPVVRQQMALAAVRLADALNDLIGQ
jgi:hypothetical protein